MTGRQKAHQNEQPTYWIDIDLGPIEPFHFIGCLLEGPQIISNQTGKIISRHKAPPTETAMALVEIAHTHADRLEIGPLPPALASVRRR